MEWSKAYHKSTEDGNIDEKGWKPRWCFKRETIATNARNGCESNA
jgi:hypothetical protein